MGVLRVAPVGLYTYLSSLPRVWSPLQGYAPWALEGVAPLGLLLPASLKYRREEAKPCLRSLGKADGALFLFLIHTFSCPRVGSPLQGYAPWALEGVAPLGLLLLVCSKYRREEAKPCLRSLGKADGAPFLFLIHTFSCPRVWSPLQGYAPWALEGVAPLGLLLLVCSKYRREEAKPCLRSLGKAQGVPSYP